MTKFVKPGWRRNYAILSPSTQGETLLDIDPDHVQDIYKTHGAVLFRGYRLDAESFGALTDRFCTHAVFNESGGRDVVDGNRVIQTVNKGDKAFPLHPELSREPWKPDVCFFGCITPPESGGETTICDGTKLVRKLPKRIYTQLADRRLLYRRLSTAEETRFWLGVDEVTDDALQYPPEDCPFTFERHKGNIFRTFTAPALHKPMFSDALCFGNFLLFSRYHNNNYTYPTYEDGSLVPAKVTDIVRLVGEATLAPVRWHANDVMMLDNTRFMHGRRRIKDVDQRYILTYFGFLNFAVPSVEEGPNPRWRDPAAWRNVQMEMAEAA